jgi:NADH-quinone oxidoreductase subunit J
MAFQSILFYFFASFLITSSIMVVTTTNAVYSIFFLILVFCNATFLLLLLNVEFLALTLILVYIGAVAVLFLFVVMMLDIKQIDKNEKNIFFLLPINLIIGFIMLISIYLILFKDLTYNLTENIYDFNHFNWFDILTPLSNIELIGQFLYTFGFFYFIQAGIILLLAMIGAIVLTMQKGQVIRRQHISEQLSRQIVNSFFVIQKK